MKNALLEVMQPIKKEIWLGIITAVFSSLLELLGFCSFALIIDSLANESFRYVYVLGAFLLMLGAFIIRAWAFNISHIGAFRLEEILRHDLIAKIATIPLGEVITEGTGKLKNAILESVAGLHAFVADTTPMIGRVVAFPIFSLIALFIFDYRMALTSLVVVIVGFFFMAGAMKDNEKHRIAYERNQARINASVIEFVQAMPAVRTFSDGDMVFNRYSEAIEDYTKGIKVWYESFGFKGKLAMTFLTPLPTIITLCIVGIYLYFQGEITLGVFVASLMLGTASSDSLMPLMWLNNFVRKSTASAEGILSVLRIPSLSVPDNPKIPTHFDVSVEGVSFKYQGREEWAIKDVNLHVNEGSLCALIGESGAGKSTLAKLVSRFWDVSEGAIKIGGIDIREIDPNELMKIVSFVFQDTFLFNETIFENIARAKEGASLEQVREAAKAANIDDFIMSLPQGYESVCGERGAMLSGGQKQRITIARAILRDAPIIVLDEASAFIDPESEEEIIKALSNLIKNKTLLIIAHRLSTIIDADEILLFRGGRVIERGRHEELLARAGAYSELYEMYQKTKSWSVREERKIKERATEEER